MRKTFLAGLSAGILALAGCAETNQIATDPEAKDFETIRISRGVSDETDVVANIYARAFTEAGYSVELVDTGDTRGDYLKAMLSDEQKAGTSPSPSEPAETISNNPATVDVTPDYSGNLMLYLTHDGQLSPTFIEQQRQLIEQTSSEPAYDFGWGDGSEALETLAPAETESAQSSPTEGETTESATPAASSSPSPEFNAQAMSDSDITATLDRVLPEPLSLLDASSAEDRDSLVVTRATAAKYELASISDLADHCEDLTLGAPPEFDERSYGLKALEEVYGCKPKNFVPVESQEELEQKLAADEVQVADIFSAQASINDDALVRLTDPSSIFIPQQIVPVIATDELPDSAREAINNVNSRLSTEDLRNFDRLTSGSGAISKEDVAKFWLEQSTE